MLRMNPNYVSRYLRRIKALADSSDARAHDLEDRLHRRVLEAIANEYYTDCSECARLALTSLEIRFSRWYS